MALVENNPQARMQIRSLGELQQPAQCYICGSGNCDAGYLDFGTFVDYYGALYFCMTCVQEAANTIGWLSPDEAKSLNDVYAKKQQEYEEAQKELEDARTTITHLRGTLRSALLSDDSSVSEPPRESEVVDGPFKSGKTEGTDTTESDPSSGRRNIKWS